MNLTSTVSTLAFLFLAGGTWAQVPWTEYTVTPGPSVRERPAGASDGNVFYLSGGNNGTASQDIEGERLGDGLSARTRPRPVAYVSSWGRGVVSCGHNGGSRENDIWARVGTGCILATPASPASGDITIAMDVTSPYSMSTDLTFEYSIDGGMTFLLCQPAASSLLSNPAPGTPVGMSTFLWDSVADMVGSLMPQAGVLVRVSIFDAGAPAPGTSGCQTLPFDIDNIVPPSCTVMTPASLAGGEVSVDLDITSPNSPTVDTCP